MKIHETPARLSGEPLFETRVPTDLGLVTPLSIRLANELEAARLLDAAERDRIETAFAEAIKNAMVHGNRENSAQFVAVRIFRAGDGWSLSVLDQGKGFTEGKISDPDDPGFAWLDRGRGIHLMCHLMDSVEYYCGGRQVVLSRRPSSARSAPPAAPTPSTKPSTKPGTPPTSWPRK